GAVVDLPGSTVIECNNVIGHHSLVGIKCEDMKYKVSQDIPKYMMVSGERAELRGLNLEGLRRHSFSDSEDLSLCMISILRNTKFVVNSCPSLASGGDNLLQTIDPKC
ncbi:Acyl-[acyl-carrier-protein]--UDP-N-acetylglucosamine O-acyltransferase, partial [Actinidia chinensis var. chinensis]